MKVRLVTDGACSGNPGPASFGYVLYDEAGGVLASRGEPIGHGTNNVAEYRALLAGLAAAEEAGADEVEVAADSQLMVRQIRGEYRVKNPSLQRLFGQAILALARFRRWSVTDVPRNDIREADRLARRALKTGAVVREPPCVEGPEERTGKGGADKSGSRRRARPRRVRRSARR